MSPEYRKFINIKNLIDYEKSDMFSLGLTLVRWLIFFLKLLNLIKLILWNKNKDMIYYKIIYNKFKIKIYHKY